jgi:flavin-dependent dehydrogenase
MEAFDPEMLELYLIDVSLGYAWVMPKRSSISLGVGRCLAYSPEPLKMLTAMCNTAGEFKNINLKISSAFFHLLPAGS